MTAHITKTWFEDGKLITEVFEEKEIYKREWIGLTDEEMHECAGEYPWTPTGLKCVRAIEAKLRSKNERL
jgi:hypothetical protein